MRLEEIKQKLLSCPIESIDIYKTEKTSYDFFEPNDSPVVTTSTKVDIDVCFSDDTELSLSHLHNDNTIQIYFNTTLIGIFFLDPEDEPLCQEILDIIYDKII